MAYEYTPKEGYGSFISNAYKKSEKSPDYTGTIMLDGKIYKLGIWHSRGETNGKKWERLSARVDREQESNYRPAKKEVDPFKDDSEIPF